MEDQVIVQTAFAAQPAIQHAVEDHGVIHVELDHRVDVVALQEEFGLPAVARKTVEDEAKVPIVLVEPTADDLFDDVVRHQFAGSREPSNAGAQLGVALEVPTEDVADTDVNQVEILGQQFCLGSFAAALDTHDDELIHPTLDKRGGRNFAGFHASKFRALLSAFAGRHKAREAIAAIRGQTVPNEPAARLAAIRPDRLRTFAEQSAARRCAEAGNE